MGSVLANQSKASSLRLLNILPQYILKNTG